LDTANILIGFAEIAIALAGFTTISTIIVRISDSTSRNLLAVRLKTILLFSIHLVLLAIAPTVLFQLQPEGDHYWRWSALLSLCAGIIVAAIGFIRLMPTTINDPKNSWLQTISVTLLGTVSLVTGWLAFAGNHPAFWYFATLALILGANLVMLAGLILSFPIFDVHRKSESRE